MYQNTRQLMKSLAAQYGIILLYHSVAESIAEPLQHTLHNIRPVVLQSHLRQLGEYFQIVPLEEFSRAKRKRGLAAITFDDGYKNVLENALPILAAFNYPATLFLNPVTFLKKWNWRDKVRYIIGEDLVGQLQHQFDFNYSQGRFYRYSKHRKNNSETLDRFMDSFLAGHQINIYPDYPYLQKVELLSHPLISYGNHSVNHYVLSSLNSRQQQHEITLAKDTLEGLHHAPISRIFSVPFGGVEDINDATLSILQRSDYSTLLLSRKKLQPDISQTQTVQVLERFMPRYDDLIDEITRGFQR